MALHLIWGGTALCAVLLILDYVNHNIPVPLYVGVTAIGIAMVIAGTIMKKKS